jgi:hypothetical protein
LYGEQGLIGTAHQNEILRLSYPAPSTLRPILETSINDDVCLDRESAERSSPMPFVPANGPPLNSAVGDARRFASSSRKRGLAKATDVVARRLRVI